MIIYGVTLTPALQAQLGAAADPGEPALYVLDWTATPRRPAVAVFRHDGSALSPAEEKRAAALLAAAP